ncbi:F-box domain-containing protein [Apiospora phragmitis]|uniref:F-box domain-containing protein n=1 Tax=Apiospora phragmitis TaxID=2905665 RepID=A0ABR1VJ19_9PEZI
MPQWRCWTTSSSCRRGTDFPASAGGSPGHIKRQLWAGLDAQQGLRLCRHLVFLEDPWRLPELRMLREPDWPLAPFRTAGHCATCLTDYTFALRCDREGPGFEITTYHQLGACRMPDDWMWQCFVGNMLPPGVIVARQHFARKRLPPGWGVTRQQYIDTDYPPGAVMERWDLGRAAEERRMAEALVRLGLLRG